MSCSASHAPLGAILGGHPADAQPFLPPDPPPDLPLPPEQGFWWAAVDDLRLHAPDVLPWMPKLHGADLVTYGQGRLVLQIWTSRLTQDELQRLCSQASDSLAAACARVLALTRQDLEIRLRVAHAAGLDPGAPILAMSRGVFQAALRGQAEVRFRFGPGEPSPTQAPMVSADDDLAELRIALAGRGVMRVRSLIDFQLADQRALMALERLLQPDSDLQELVVGSTGLGLDKDCAMVDLDALRRRQSLISQRLSAPPLSACLRVGLVQKQGGSEGVSS